MINFTGRPAMYMAAGPKGEPPESARRGLVLNEEVLVGHRVHRTSWDAGSHDVVSARVRGFCVFEKFGACFNYTVERTDDPRLWQPTDSSYWCPIAGEGVEWCRPGADEETRAAVMAAAVMC